MLIPTPLLVGSTYQLQGFAVVAGDDYSFCPVYGIAPQHEGQQDAATEQATLEAYLVVPIRKLWDLQELNLANFAKIRDRQVSLAVGAPMVINDLDCDIEDLAPEDFEDGFENTAHYLIALASLSKISESSVP